MGIIITYVILIMAHISIVSRKRNALAKWISRTPSPQNHIMEHMVLFSCDNTATAVAVD